MAKKKKIPPELKADLRRAVVELRELRLMVEAKIEEIDRRRAAQR